MRRLGLGILFAALAALALPALAGANHSRIDLLSTGPTGGAGSQNAFFEGASQDGLRTFFSTTEALTSADTDSSKDVYQSFGGVTTLLSIGPTGGNGAFDASFAGASKDGTRVFFTTGESLVASDTDSSADVYEASGGSTTLVSTGTIGGNGAFDAFYDGASDDGARVFFHTRESLLSADTDTKADVYKRQAGATSRISLGGSGGNGAQDAFFAGASADGTTVFFTTRESLESTDTDSSRDLYQRAAAATTLLSTGILGGVGAFDVVFEGASASGAHVFFSTREKLEAADTDDSFDVYDRAGSTTTLVSAGTGANLPGDAIFEGASTDGAHVFFSTDVTLTSSDTDRFLDVYERFSGTTTLASVGPSGGAGAMDADFAAASDDGSKLFFTTRESLLSADTDASRDVYQRAGGATTLLSTGTGGGNGAYDAFYEGRSDDGSRIFFWTRESLVSADTDSSGDVYERFGGATTLISAGPAGGNGTPDAFLAGTSKDGGFAFFSTQESLVSADTDSATDLYQAVATGTLTITKDALPDDPQDFSFTAGGGLSPTSFALDDDLDPALSNTRTFTALLPGSGYSLAETLPGGWDLQSATCDDASPPSNVSISPGENVTCTFTNRKHGQIIVVEDSQPDDPQDFSFTAGGGLSPSSFSLDDDSDPTLANTQTFSSVAPGSGYSISQTVPSGWDLASATCNDGSPVTNVDVAPGETVTCTFTDGMHGQIEVVEDAQPNDPQDFSFTAGGGLSPSSFSLDDDSDPTLANTQTFSSVAPGSGYSISQTVPSGWDLASATCNDGSPVTNVDVAPGETVTCTFTDTKQGSPPASYTRPVGASPMRMSLVPAFKRCITASATGTHAAPLAGASCSPVPRSSLVAIGPRSIGLARMIVLGSGKCATFDSTHCYPDFTIRFSVTDVRSGSPVGSDYDPAGSTDLTATATIPNAGQRNAIQITDQNNQTIGDTGGPFDKSATVVPLSFPIPMSCSPTSDTTIGSTCIVQTTVNTLFPGAAVVGKRAIWQVGQFQVLDQGANGNPGDSDDNVFEVQGVLIP